VSELYIYNMSLDIFRLFEKDSIDDLNSNSKDLACISLLLDSRQKSVKNKLKHCYFTNEEKVLINIYLIK